MLLFDEADALFGKCREDNYSHDRFANIRTNFLLWRLEDDHGMVVLTTHLKKQTDFAFLSHIGREVNDC